MSHDPGVAVVKQGDAAGVLRDRLTRGTWEAVLEPGAEMVLVLALLENPGWWWTRPHEGGQRRPGALEMCAIRLRTEAEKLVPGFNHALEKGDPELIRARHAFMDAPRDPRAQLYALASLGYTRAVISTVTARRPDLDLGRFVEAIGRLERVSESAGEPVPVR